MQVSFNGHDEGSRAYEDDMLGLDYDAARAGVERLLAAADRRVRVYVSAVETSRNQAALAGFVEFWRARGAIAGVVPCHSRGGTIVALRPRATTPSAPRCGLFNTRSFVSWDGRILACCHDVDGATEVGDVARDDAQAIIGRKLEVMRRGDWFPVCATCDEPARLTTLSPQHLRTPALAG